MTNVVTISGIASSGKTTLVHHAMEGFARDKTVLLVTDTERVFPLPNLVTHLQIDPDGDLPISEIRGQTFDVVFVDVKGSDHILDAITSACRALTATSRGTVYIVDHM